MDDKIAALIDKLQELKNDNAAMDEVSHYAKMLYLKLLHSKNEKEKNESTKKVSVILPGYHSIHKMFDKEKEGQSNQAETAAVRNEEKKAEETIEEEELKPAEAAATYPVKPADHDHPQTSLWENRVAEKKEQYAGPVRRELNDTIVARRPSLNDRLKTEKEEIAGKLGNTPVKNLSQAIGLNEKFGFINELFRGDQSLYNRSVKTINECQNLNEAMYWIERELKIKLGWQDNNKTVQQFYTLVKKRFS